MLNVHLPKRATSQMIAMFVLAGSLLAQAGIASTTWTPGSGGSMVLSASTNNAVDSAVSRGSLAVSATVMGNGMPRVAYAIEYVGDPAGSWYENTPGNHYFLLDSVNVSKLKKPTGETKVNATIPLIDQVFLYPALVEVQRIHVWVGSSSMQVDPAAGVTNFECHEDYDVLTDFPSYSILPPAIALKKKISRKGLIPVGIFRKLNLESSETFTLSVTGHQGLVESILFPGSVTVPSGSSDLAVIFDFDPTRTLNMPSAANSVSVTATSTNGTSVSCSLGFSGALMIGAGETELNGPGGEERDCYPAAILASQPVGNSQCGECVKTSATPSYPADTPPEGAVLFYYPYRCPDGESTCLVKTTTVSHLGTIVVKYTETCTIQRPFLAWLFPATFGSMVPKYGHRACYRVDPSTTLNTFDLPDCS